MILNNGGSGLMINDLQALGFTVYEAKIYLETLQAAGVPKTAYEIALAAT